MTLADTTGSGTPTDVRETVGNIAWALDGKIALGIHIHYDMGVATANAAAGVTCVDVTVGGIGERTGNAPLEEVAVLLAEQGDSIPLTLKELVPVCRRVHELLFGGETDRGVVRALLGRRKDRPNRGARRGHAGSDSIGRRRTRGNPLDQWDTRELIQNQSS